MLLVVLVLDEEFGGVLQVWEGLEVVDVLEVDVILLVVFEETVGRVFGLVGRGGLQDAGLGVEVGLHVGATVDLHGVHSAGGVASGVGWEAVGLLVALVFQEHVGMDLALRVRGRVHVVPDAEHLLGFVGLRSTLGHGVVLVLELVVVLFLSPFAFHELFGEFQVVGLLDESLDLGVILVVVIVFLGSVAGVVAVGLLERHLG